MAQINRMKFIPPKSAKPIKRVSTLAEQAASFRDDAWRAISKQRGMTLQEFDKKCGVVTPATPRKPADDAADEYMQFLAAHVDEALAFQD
jgi:hypothetical protein